MTSSSNARPSAIWPARIRRLADPQPPERHELGVAEALADPGRLVEDRVGGRWLALEQAPERVEHEQISSLHAVVPAIVEQPLAPRDPAPAARRLALDQQVEAEPERAARRAPRSPPTLKLVMRPRPHVARYPTSRPTRCAAIASRSRSSGSSRRLAIRGRQLGVGVAPGLPAEGLPASIERPQEPRPTGVTARAANAGIWNWRR